MDYERIGLECVGAVTTLRLRQPETLNALTFPLIEELQRAVRVVDQSGARVLRLAAEGRAFCSGANLSAGGEKASGGKLFAGGDAGRVLETHLNPLIEQFFSLRIPVVSAVNGAAAGAGCSLALLSDFVIAARSSYFLQAFANVGLVPDAGSTWLLPRLIGKARATAMMMLGERISAEQALAWGMIYDVVDDDALEGASLEFCERLARGPTIVHGLIRTGLRECLEASLTQGLAIERENQRIAGSTQDALEGVSAFQEKRPPRFGGR